MHRTHTSHQTLLPSRGIISQIKIAKDALFRNSVVTDTHSSNSRQF